MSPLQGLAPSSEAACHQPETVVQVPARCSQMAPHLLATGDVRPAQMPCKNRCHMQQPVCQRGMILLATRVAGPAQLPPEAQRRTQLPICQ
mmetsp:Transcript_97923/g.272533  ORF Transcript_97923/g.272533 Transcript_97923/m.272533 type:complete len:91 (+) Transcript_97923:281-553(+)